MKFKIEQPNLSASADLSDLDELKFQKLAGFLRRTAGINLDYTAKNLTLLSVRVRKLMNNLKISSIQEVIGRIDRGEKPFIASFIEIMTTNTTHFFREPAHFDILTSSLPLMLEKNKARGTNELRVWCAAASTGQEPYTIAMSILEALEGKNFSLKMLATDIDSLVLQKAKSGTYTEHEAEGIPKFLKDKYFKKSIGQRGGAEFTAKPDLRRQINYAIFNLLDASYPFRHKFDIIFCRNVFIYFEPKTVETIVNKMNNFLNKDGRLFVGHSESFVNIKHTLDRVATAVYKPAA